MTSKLGVRAASIPSSRQPAWWTSLDLEEEHVRKLIERCRQDLREQYEVVAGRPPQSHLLIRNPDAATG